MIHAAHGGGCGLPSGATQSEALTVKIVSSDRTDSQNPACVGVASLIRRFGLGSLVIALLIGIQLGAIPWRYRRQIWQVQGFMLGALAGYLVGRISGRESPSTSRRPSDCTGNQHKPG